MSDTKGKVLASTVAFSAGTGFGIFVCLAVVNLLIKHNKQLFANFLSDVINKFLFADLRNSNLRGYAGRPYSNVTYNDPLRYNRPVKKAE